jgi:hypothetical protein
VRVAEVEPVSSVPSGLMVVVVEGAVVVVVGGSVVVVVVGAVVVVVVAGSLEPPELPSEPASTAVDVVPSSRATVTLSKESLVVSPTRVTAESDISEITPTIKPYSTIVAPRSVLPIRAKTFMSLKSAGSPVST